MPERHSLNKEAQRKGGPGYLKMNFGRDCDTKEIKKKAPKTYTHTNRR